MTREHTHRIGIEALCRGCAMIASREKRQTERAAYLRDYTGTAPVTTHNDRPLTPVCGHYRHWADCDCGAAPDADLGHWDFEQCDVCRRPVCFAYSCPSGWDWVGITLMCRACAGKGTP